MNYSWYNIALYVIIIYGKSTLGATLLSHITEHKAIYICTNIPERKNSALTYITPFGPAYNYETASIYNSVNGYKILPNSHDCDFEPRSNCTILWNGPSITLVSSIAINKLYDLHPVLDERWEKFPIFFSDAYKTEQYIFKQELTNVGVSVRTDGDVNIILCEDKMSPYKCYWFAINENKSTLSICEIHNLLNKEQNKSNCNELHSGTGITVSENFWSHLKIFIYDNFTHIKVEDDKSFILFSGNLPETVSVSKALFMSNKNALWKVHDYNYLSITWNGGYKWINVGPALKAVDIGPLCLSLYMTMCRTCTLSFRFYPTYLFKEVHGNISTARQEWQYKRLIIKSTRRNMEYRLQVKISGGYNGFWLIDDVRRCHEQEWRILSLTTPVNDNDTVSCQSLDNPKQWSSIKGGQIQQSNLTVCENATFTGSKCDVSCMSVLGADSCSKLIVCEPSSSRTMPSCNCAAGYRGSRCEQNCQQGFYGSECKKVCQPCRGFCLKSSGSCPNGNQCILNDTDPGCTEVMFAPRNLTVNWNENDMKISWNHPKLVNKDAEVTYFLIMIKQIETILKSLQLKNSNNYTVNAKQNHYIFKVPDKFPLSSTYEVEVHAFIGLGTLMSNVATVIKASPPVSPQFLGDLEWGTQSNSSLNIIIPAVSASTITNSSSMYIMICSPGDKQPDLKKENTLYYKLHNWTECQGNSSIPKEIEISEKTTNFTLQDSKNWFENGKLSPDSLYIIHVVYFNEYKGIYKHAIISISTKELFSTNPALYALLLLFLIPPIFYLVYLKTRKTNTSYESVPLENIYKKDDIFFGSYLYVKDKKAFVNKMRKLSNFTKEKLIDTDLEKEFESLPKGATKSWTYGMCKQNIFKNRISHITAYDQSRVVLQKINGDPFSDFINANFIDGYNQNQCYIGTQNPKLNTVNDFWRMIWEHNVHYIVMITSTNEYKEMKHEIYWPKENESREFRDMSVTVKRQEHFTNYIIRNFEVKCHDTVRQVLHLQFISWPENGVPEHLHLLLPFLRTMRVISLESPVVVHCNVGIGRTGALILLDICIRKALNIKCQDPLNYLRKMRDQRFNMITSVDQYKFVYIALLGYLSAPDSNIPCDGNFCHIIDDVIKSKTPEQEIHYLETIGWHCDILLGNASDYEISPYAFNGEYCKFTNTITVDGFKIKGQYVTVETNQVQIQTTNLWLLIIELKMKLIIFFKTKNVHAHLWPVNIGQYIKYPNMFIICISRKDLTDYTRYELEINMKNSEEVLHVNVLHYSQEVGAGATVRSLAVLVDAVVTLTQQRPAVLCGDTTATGMFTCLAHTLECMCALHQCDVLDSLRAVRASGLPFLPTAQQLRFMYSVAAEFYSLGLLDGYLAPINKN